MTTMTNTIARVIKTIPPNDSAASAHAAPHLAETRGRLRRPSNPSRPSLEDKLRRDEHEDQETLVCAGMISCRLRSRERRA